jgi:hypothetical protein
MLRVPGRDDQPSTPAWLDCGGCDADDRTTPGILGRTPRTGAKTKEGVTMRLEPATTQIERDPAVLRDASGRRLHVARRWWIDADHHVRDGWPAVGDEDSALAIGWVASDRPIGVIEAPADHCPSDLLDALEARFPSRRWFAGAWDVPENRPVHRAA